MPNIPDIDKHLTIMVLQAQLIVAHNNDEEALGLADLVLELHEHMRHGHQPPESWPVKTRMVT